MKQLTILIFLSVALLCACTQVKNDDNGYETDYCSDIYKNDTVRLSTTLGKFTELMEYKTGVYVLEDGGGALVTRAWLCENSEKSIDVQYFIFSFDNVGLIACDYLVRAANRGVKIRILVDDIMVDASIDEILALDAHENISIKIYNPGVNLGKNIFNKIQKVSTDFRSANQRMHNKTYIVDGGVVITGGRNIADEYFDYDHEYNFRDRDVLLLGNVTKSVQKSFEEYWGHSLSVPVTALVDEADIDQVDSGIFDKLHQYACNPENFWPQVREEIVGLHHAFEAIQLSGQFHWLDSVYFVSDKPGKNDGKAGLGGGGICTDTLIALIKQSNVSLDIQTPYLITTDVGLDLFREAVARGVKVRILTNSLASTDNLEAFSGYQRDRDKILQTGVEVYEFRPDAEVRYKMMTGSLQKEIDYVPIFGLHSKSMVVDRKITVIGTFNLDPRSANLNTECITIMHSQKVSGSVLKGMEEEFRPENSWFISSDFNPDSQAGWKKRIGAWARIVVPKAIL